MNSNELSFAVSPFKHDMEMNFKGAYLGCNLEKDAFVCVEEVSAAWALWWLPIVLLLILLLVLAIVLFVSCTVYRNRGEDYEGTCNITHNTLHSS